MLIIFSLKTIEVIKNILQFSCSVVFDSLQPHGLQHTRLPCPSPTPEACSTSHPSSWWCHPTISSSVRNANWCFIDMKNYSLKPLVSGSWGGIFSPHGQLLMLGTVSSGNHLCPSAILEPDDVSPKAAWQENIPLNCFLWTCDFGGKVLDPLPPLEARNPSPRASRFSVVSSC